ncbi:MAG: suppressor of fused domain protein [Crocinitomicaceae bacterium]|jgi:hypothetical protein|nr:suppressor of fused domain protein [Crocinitomicaceae bacterium]
MKVYQYFSDKGYQVEVLEQFAHFQVIQVHIPEKRVTLWMTEGLSYNEMPVPEKHYEERFVEVYFCMPSYWDLKSTKDKFRWPLHWLEKLGNHVLNKKTWFGHGHTIQCYPDFRSLSESMKPNHLFLVKPMLMSDQLTDIQIDGNNITFLGILPIYGEEMDFKQAKGTLKLLKRLTNKNIDEKLDDFRESTMKGRIRLFR